MNENQAVLESTNPQIIDLVEKDTELSEQTRVYSNQYGQFQETSKMKQKTNNYQIDKIDIIFSLLTLILGYAYTEFIMLVTPGIGYVIFVLLFIAISVGYFYTKKGGVSKKSIPFYVLTFLTALPIGLYQYNTFVLINIALTTVLGVYSVSVAGNVRIKDEMEDYMIEDLYLGFLYRPFANFGVQIKTLISIPKKGISFTKIATTGIAIAITLIITAIAVNKLSTVDNNFAKIIDNMVDIDLGINFNFFKIVGTIIASQYLFAMFYSCVNKWNSYQFNETQIITLREKRKIIPEMIFILPMIVLSIIYLIFFISHIITLQEVLEYKGIIYSEYARQGFFELCQIAILNVLLCLSTRGSYAKTQEKSKVISGLSCLLAFSTILIMITAVIKLGLYMSYYGLTIKRIHAAWALFIIFITCILLIVSQSKKINFKKIVSLTIIISYTILSLAGMNQIAAKYNFTYIAKESFEQNYYIDSDCDAYTPYLIQLWEEETNIDTKKSITEKLINPSYRGYAYDVVGSWTLEAYLSDKQKEDFRTTSLENNF